MENATIDFSSYLASAERLNEEEFTDLMSDVRSGEKPRMDFGEILEGQIAQRGDELAADTAMALKVAQGFYALCRYDEALGWLDKAGTSKTQCLLKAWVLRDMGNFTEAAAQFERAEGKGYDSFDMSMAIVDCLRRGGEIDQATERLKRVSRVGEIRAEYRFQQGRLLDAQGLHEEAMEEYSKAVELDGRHTEALFYLAFSYDLYGEDRQAIEHYRRCIECDEVHVSALLNLAVLYEDAESYMPAWNCVRQVLTAYPNHERARLFLKDIESSMTMFYDEEQERRLDEHNQVLEIPVSDFELSVRSRNCLRKMNIKTLGDLLKVSESELLAYKNFGETSLKEVKCILSMKGLRLGQMADERKGDLATTEETEEEAVVDDSVLSKQVSELEMSVRSHKCLQKLNIVTVSDLIQHTEAELLGCPNFGQTSLVEIDQRLKELGLDLRKLED